MSNKATVELRVDNRCKHGLTPKTCAYCLGHAPSQYGASTGMAWIRQVGYTQRFIQSKSAYNE